MIVEHIKKFWRTLVLGTIGGIALQVLIGIPWNFLPSLLIFIVVLNIIVWEINDNKEAKEAIKNSIYFFIGVVAFIGMRTVFGYLIDMPVSDSYGQLDKVGGLMRVGWRGISAPAIIVDILFVLPGAMFAWALVKGGKICKATMALICIALMVWVVWGIKQPAHALALKRQFQSFISLDTNHRNNDALKNEAAAASSYGVAKTSITRFYRLDKETDSITKNETALKLPQGSIVLQAKPGEKAHIAHGQAFTPVILPDKDGVFVGGEWVWVEANSFNWVDGGNVLPDKFSIVKSEDGKVWTVYFYTDEPIKILDNIKVGQKFIVSGAPRGELKWPGIENSAMMYDVPQGKELTNIFQNGLCLKYKAGKNITIRFI